MRDRRDGRTRLAESRRGFLRATVGLAAAGVTFAVPAAGLQAGGRRGGPEAPAAAAPDCDCGAEAALPLVAAACLEGRYVGLASDGAGLRVFSLTVDRARRVSLAAPIDVDVPADLVMGSLGLVRGRLALSGGRPFTWDSYEVDDEVDDELRASLKRSHPHIPTSGRRRVDVMGVRPAAFLLDPPRAEPLELPEMPRRVFAVATAVAETDGGALLMMIEHSGELAESYYAAAVDVLEERSGGWTVGASLSGLGESGPNHLVVNGDEFVAGLNTAKGALFVGRGSSSLSSDGSPAEAGRIVGVLPSAGGFALLAADGGPGPRAWSLVVPAGGRLEISTLRLRGDAVVGAVAVAGTRGQSIVLGRRSALLVDDASVLLGPAAHGGSHVL